MLKKLYIKNFTLIDTLTINFDAGFSVITGETGAGKSIIIGAISLLLGQRADTKLIKHGQNKCIIEAFFDLSKYDMRQLFKNNDIDYDPQECIIRRELTSSGKSRAFVNDTPVSLSIMREIGEHLVDIHSQHQNLLLSKEDFQLNVVDIIADDKKQLKEYHQLYDSYKDASDKLKKMMESLQKDKENEEFIKFQYNELEQAKFQDGEQELLEQDSQTLNHAEDIKTAFFTANSLFSDENNGIVENFKSSMMELRKIEDVYPQAKSFLQRMDSLYIEIKDIAQDLDGATEEVDYDPNRLEEINSRLDTIYSLQQKYHVKTISELKIIEQNLKKKIELIDNSDEEIKEQEDKKAACLKSCLNKAAILTNLRKEAAHRIENEMKKRLVPLGIPYVKFEVRITPKDISADGVDKVSFLFSANKSTALEPVSQVASGGEIARVMLSIKAMISGVVKLPTIIFDEIDTGVSGKAAEMMGRIMQEMGDCGRQVISITHLPQIAAHGKKHYKVTKTENENGTVSNMTLLDEDQRVREIAQMLSGSNITDAAIDNARSLLQSSTNK